MKRRDEFRKIFGKNVKNARGLRQMSQTGLAKLVGVSHSYIYQIENQGKIPNFPLAMRIANALKIKPEDLLRG